MIRPKLAELLRFKFCCGPTNRGHKHNKISARNILFKYKRLVYGFDVNDEPFSNHINSVLVKHISGHCLVK